MKAMNTMITDETIRQLMRDLDAARARAASLEADLYERDRELTEAAEEAQSLRAALAEADAERAAEHDGRLFVG